MIEVDLARKFIEQITQYTDYNINIMNEQGYIIASRDPKRIGTFHEIAYHIVTGKEDMVVTSGEYDYPGVRRGINMVINIDGKRAGVVGITGDPEEVRPVAMITKMSIEAMLKYEKQQNELLRRQNRKERFLSLLIHEKYAEPAMLRSVARQLNYSEEMIRVPILCTLSDGLAETFLETVKKGSCHSKEDISFTLDRERALIFKTVQGNRRYMFSEYKEMVAEYLRDALRLLRQQGETCRYFVGSFQNSFTQYYFGYQHCKWLEETADAALDCVFFYDFSGIYLQSVMPMNELQRMFHVFDNVLDSDFRQSYLEIIGALIKTNWNLVEAARELFMHKNTLVYRYNKLKDRLDVNPIVSSSDRCFVEAFYVYLIKKK
ncbi:sugar diacid recognition domain-containing protein [[Clostridium] symbiosum]|uniref:CdaR family transcriptional regulator n=1 Tax=Clostridium symbiosum TaxID=1512 RepID=UPI001D085E72|nr:sugar diacid recognition domain-containing protein [[Clostridium] symbiosum]MCB6611101.1 helix-turn-helix domain-containing protein [[Clostridium] symbiosum]MCB6930257.1 helix-turn-helix domain-containing protein [[Clostridium] symbiosum]